LKTDFDGVLGLSKPMPDPNNESQNMSSIFDDIYAQGYFNKDMFSFSLGRNEETSAITLGGYDPTRIDGPINWNKVIWEDYWMVALDKVLLNGEDTQICNHDCAAVIDSGTSLITLPSGDLFVLSCNLMNTQNNRNSFDWKL
jgi:hypothetical protein